MMIPPCKKQIQQDIVTFVLAFGAGLYLVWVLNWNPIATFGCFFICLFATISMCHSVLYFGRSFSLDSNGFTISFGRYSKKYTWDKVNCLCCENRKWRIGDSEWPNPGVIISVKPINKPAAIAAMTYCRYTHPFQSVFLAYKSERTDNPASSGKMMHIGYVVEKDWVLEYVQFDNMQGVL